MRFLVQFEMEDHHCMSCPMCQPDDSCFLQEEDYFDTWDDQMLGCPLDQLVELNETE